MPAGETFTPCLEIPIQTTYWMGASEPKLEKYFGFFSLFLLAWRSTSKVVFNN